MKTTNFLFMLIGCAVLTHGVAYDGPSNATAAQSPTGIPNITVSGHQFGSSPSACAALGESVGNKTVNNPAVRPQDAVPLAGTSSRYANNQSPNSAVIGGPANSTKNTATISGKLTNPTKNSAVINGTGMNRKH